MKNICLNDNIHGQIIITNLEKKVLDSIPFNRLHDVYQDSLTFLSFPTNRTKRFEHCVGVLKICSDMVISSLKNSTIETLTTLKEVIDKCIEKVIIDINSNQIYEQALNKKINKKDYFSWLVNVGLNKDVDSETDNLFFERLIPKHIIKYLGEVEYYFFLQTVRLAAMLHDIGHPPFSHVVEYAIRNAAQKEYFTDKGKEFKKIIDNITKPQTKNEKRRKPHEVMGDIIVGKLGIHIAIECKNTYKTQLNEWALMIFEAVKNCYLEEEGFKFMHSYVDGSIDGDRLDFVVRDMCNAGFNDLSRIYSRIIDNIKIIKIEKVGLSLAYSTKCVCSIESFLNNYTEFYSNLIFHHRVVKLEYLLENCVTSMIETYLCNFKDNDKQEKDNNNKNIDSFNEIEGLWKPFEEKWISDCMDYLSQWNDSWLMTLMKKKYFELADNTNRNENEEQLFLYLEELLRNKKHYHSLIKHRDNYVEFDDSIFCSFVDNINDYLSSFMNANTKNIGSSSNKSIYNNVFEILQNIINSGNQNKTFINDYSNFIIATFGNKEIILKIIEHHIKSIENVERVIISPIVVKNPATGKDIFLYNDYKEYILDDLSNINMRLDLSLKNLPSIFIFVKYKDDNTYNENEKISRLKVAGKEIGKDLAEKLIVEMKNTI